MARKLGILIAGASGSIASTTIAALDLMQQEIKPKIGMISEALSVKCRSANSSIELPLMSNIHISGWDLCSEDLRSSLERHEVLDKYDIHQISPSVLNQKPMLAPQDNEGIDVSETSCFGYRIEKLCKDIRHFRDKHQLDDVVVINCISTQETPSFSKYYETEEEFQYACQNKLPCITPSMEYAYAAVLESAAFVNFTPNIAVVPAIVEMSKKYKTPLAGRDGKTGQTLLKTAIAPLLKLRELIVQGWYSINILGNEDGKTLSEPASNQTKVLSKESCLEHILDYPVEDHQVHIHYYKPRGDNKESWDNIDVKGFLGYPMQLKINFLAKDSILAAPLILDLARLMSVAIQREEYGMLEFLSVFFKYPEVPSSSVLVHDVFLQRNLLDKWVSLWLVTDKNG